MKNILGIASCVCWALALIELEAYKLNPALYYLIPVVAYVFTSIVLAILYAGAPKEKS